MATVSAIFSFDYPFDYLPGAVLPDRPVEPRVRDDVKRMMSTELLALGSKRVQ